MPGQQQYINPNLAKPAPPKPKPKAVEGDLAEVFTEDPNLKDLPLHIWHQLGPVTNNGQFAELLGNGDQSGIQE